jgi:aryl-alcohol dehydrogenase-like predicted oxidoreductase
METRRLGRTGHESSVAILGAAAFWAGNPDDTERAFTAALDAGANHLDIAPRYGDAQRLVGPLVPAVRDRLFVACKTTRRNADGVRAQLEESLELLGCDAFDLYQLHGVTDLDEIEGRVDAAGAILRARDEGLCRYVGITGHDLGAPAAHAEAVRRWDLDTVMFPVNPRMWAEPQYRADAEALLALAAERDLGVMAIKAAAARPWTDGDRWANTWYEPHRDQADLARGIGFALSTPGVHAFCTPGDLNLLPRALDAAATYAPLDDAERETAMRHAAHEPVLTRP